MIYENKKDKAFSRSANCKKFFILLKECFMTAPILAYCGFGKEYIIETEASENVFTQVLSLYGENRFFYTMDFFSHKHSPYEINHEI